MSYELKVFSHFWRKESNSLFDYETTDMTTSNVTTSSGCMLFHEGNTLRKVKERVKQKSLNYLISITSGKDDEFRVKIDEGYYSPGIDSNPRINSDNWVVIRHTVLNEENGFELRVGSIIKLGKVIFKVKDVFVECEKSNEGRNAEEDVLRVGRKPVLDRNLTNNENNFVNRVEDEEIGNEMENENDEIQFQEQGYSQVNGVNNLNANDASNNILIPRGENLVNMLNQRAGGNSSIQNNNPIINSPIILNNNLQSSKVINILNKKVKSLISSAKNKKKSSHRETSNNICRICLGDGTEDKLLSICKCIGSVKYIHLGCLRKWLVSKISVKTYNHLTVFSYKNLECELCKSVISDRIKIKDKLVNLINPNAIAESALYAESQKYTSYIALECVKDKPLPTNETQEKKTVYIINMKDKTTLKLGRATDSDVRMTDISVSRNHAMLKIYNGKMYLKDNNSKFGTHINADLNLEMLVLPQKQLALQCGRFFLLFNLKRTCWSWLCCDKSEKMKKNLYSEYNLCFKEFFDQHAAGEIKFDEKDVVRVAEFEEDELNPPEEKREERGNEDDVTGNNIMLENNDYSDKNLDKVINNEILQERVDDKELNPDEYKETDKNFNSEEYSFTEENKSIKNETENNLPNQNENNSYQEESIDFTNKELIKLRNNNPQDKKNINVVLNKKTATMTLQMNRHAANNNNQPIRTRNIRHNSMQRDLAEEMTKSKLLSQRDKSGNYNKSNSNSHNISHSMTVSIFHAPGEYKNLIENRENMENIENGKNHMENDLENQNILSDFFKIEEIEGENKMFPQPDNNLLDSAMKSPSFSPRVRK